MECSGSKIETRPGYSRNKVLIFDAASVRKARKVKGTFILTKLWKGLENKILITIILRLEVNKEVLS